MRTVTGVLPLIILLLTAWTGAVGAEQARGPRETIASAVDRITERIRAERERLEQNPEYARQVVREELGDLVDFKRITRLVMAEHFGKASKEQKYAFLEVFKNSLINTYASGLTLYEGQDIRVPPLEEGDVQGDNARVQMEIDTNSGQVIPVHYSLFRDSDGQWKVQNVIVNGLNLGKTFRSQFDLAMQQYQGDIDQVIANWSPELNIDGDKGGKDEQGGSAAG